MSRKDAPYVVFGAREGSKGAVGFRSRKMSGYEIHIVELSGNHKAGDTFWYSEIEKEYMALYFTTPESLDRFITVMGAVREMWRNDEQG